MRLESHRTLFLLLASYYLINCQVSATELLEMSTGAISGKVMDSSQRPIPAAQVCCYGPKGDGQDYSTDADSWGNFIIVGLQEGTYDIWADANGYLWGYQTNHKEVVVVAQDTTKGINLTLLVPASITGRVFSSDGGTIVEDVDIELWNYDVNSGTGARAQTDGSFELTELWPGRSEICARPSVESGCASTLNRLTITEGEVIEDYRLSLNRGALVSGHLSSSTENSYLQCIAVTALGMTGSYRKLSSGFMPCISGPSDENGYYSLRLPPGRYMLNVDQGYLCSLYLPLSFSPRPCEVMITDVNQQLTRDFTVFFDGAPISGYVEDVTGQFDGDVLAFAEKSHVDDPITAWTMRPAGFNQPPSDGYYTINYLVSPPSYSLYAVTGCSNDPWDFSMISVWDRLEGIPAGSSDVNFSLHSQGGSITGRVEGDLSDEDVIVLILDSENLFSGWVKREFVHGAFDFRMDHLKEGSHTAFALSSCHDEMPQCSFTVIEGETTQIPTLVFSDTKTETSSTLTGYRLYANYPNPFSASSENPKTAIRFDLPIISHVTLTVYNVLGQKVKTLLDEQKFTGSHTVNWDGKNSLGQNLASGIYLYRIVAGNFVEVKKMFLLR